MEILPSLLGLDAKSLHLVEQVIGVILLNFTCLMQAAVSGGRIQCFRQSLTYQPGVAVELVVILGPTASGEAGGRGILPRDVAI